MKYEMRAEYALGVEAAPESSVKNWHMTRAGDTIALCGRELSPRAATQSADFWGQTTTPFCHSCGAIYLREVP